MHSLGKGGVQEIVWRGEIFVSPLFPMSSHGVLKEFPQFPSYSKTWEQICFYFLTGVQRGASIGECHYGPSQRKKKKKYEKFYFISLVLSEQQLKIKNWM